MAPSVSIELSPQDCDQLLRIARESIGAGLRGDGALEVNPATMADSLNEELGAFVTLTHRESLRGCIGSMEAVEPLAQTVAGSAYGAAFRDPRFPPLAPDEFEQIRIEISVLSAMEIIPVDSRYALLAQMKPGIDGILLEDGRHRSTFLPKVWEQLPDPDRFLEQLLAKAGLPVDHWSSRMQVHRYTTLSFSEGDAFLP
jgi:hypothetical protein